MTTDTLTISCEYAVSAGDVDVCEARWERRPPLVTEKFVVADVIPDPPESRYAIPLPIEFTFASDPSTKRKYTDPVQACDADAAIAVLVSKSTCASVELDVPFQRTSTYAMPLSVPDPTTVLVRPASAELQFVGSVPGDPVTTPTIVLLRTWFVLVSSHRYPSGARVTGSWSIRIAPDDTVSITPDDVKRVAVDARAKANP